MDHHHRMKPVYLRQQSTAASPGAPPSPSMSPLHARHARTGSTGAANNMKRAQTKAAAQRLAQVMSHQPADDDDEDEDDLSLEYNPGGIGLAGGRRIRSPSPMGRRAAARSHVPVKARQPAVDEDNDQVVSKPAARSHMQVRTRQQPVDEDNDQVPSKPAARTHMQPMMYHAPVDEDDGLDDILHDYSSGSSLLSTGRSGGKSLQSRSPMTVRTRQEQPSPANSASGVRPSVSANSVDNPPLAHAHSVPIPSHPVNSVEQPSSASSSVAGQLSTSSLEQPPPGRPTSASRQGIKNIPIPSSVPISLRQPSPAISSEPTPTDIRKDKRLSLDLGSMKLRDNNPQHSNSALEDEIDMLQEENEGLLEKLRLAEDRFEEADARARLLEKQIATLGEGVSLEARLISRKEAALQQREAALKVAEQASNSEEITALRTEAETAKDEATSALEQLHEAELELGTLRNMTQRMILTKEEMEEVVLKRCWLARYWNLCLKHGVHSEIAGAKYEYWSSYAPLPVEIVLSAGQRAKEEDSSAYDDAEERERVLRDGRELSGDGNVESMLLVERGLRELASLKVEEAVAFAMAQQRRTNFMKSDEVKLPTEGQTEAFELSQEESEDVRFKQAWLTYIWRRAKNHGIEPDIAEERLQFWVNHSDRSSTSHDAVDVDRGLLEVRKLGIENQLWQESRRELETDATSKTHLESNF